MKIVCADCQEEVNRKQHYWKMGNRFFHDLVCCARFVNRYKKSILRGVRTIKFK